jgi:hypothetical protein
MKCKKCKGEISFIEWIMYWGYCFIHRLEKNGEITIKHDALQKDGE